MKILIFALVALLGLSVHAQTYSTGLLPLVASADGTSLEYSAKIEVSSTVVTLTLIGSSTRWLGIGFGTNSMTAGGDVVIFDGTNLTDRTFLGTGSTPALDANQDWTVTSNTVEGDARTVVGTRSLSTSDSSDYSFTASTSSLPLVYARGFSLNLGYHGSNGYGFTTTNLALGIESFAKNATKIYPNPATSSFVLECENIPSIIHIYSHSGQLVKTVSPSATLLHQINVDELQSGIYLIEIISNDQKSWNKLLIK